jgi:hypothetical protein
LYSFYFPPPGTKTFSLRKIRNSVEYACPFYCEDEGSFGNGELRNAADTELRRLMLMPKQVFYYLFDFGDEWWHQITVEAVDAPVEKGTYPQVLDHRGDSPAQYPDMEDEDDEDEEEE